MCTRCGTQNKRKGQGIHRATAIPATAKSPAATEPILVVAAPVKPADPADLVFEGATGAIGDPVAAAPKPKLTPEPEPKPALVLEPEVAVAIGAVPVANPVDPAAMVELERSISGTTKAKVFIKGDDGDRF